MIPGALALSITAMAVAGGIAWGQAKERLSDLEDGARSQEIANGKVQEIWREQGVLKNKIENLSQQQQAFHTDTKQAIERVLQHLRAAR